MTDGFDTLRDERPEGRCTQTFFRNHEVIAQTLRASLASGRSELRILDIGGGVLEPLLIAGVCELLRETGHLDRYQVICLDVAPEVIAIHEHLRAGQPCAIDGYEVIREPGRLSLPGLARVFSATHAEVNSWLVDPVALSGQLRPWIDLGVAHYLGVPADVCHSTVRIERFIADGLAVPTALLEHIQVIHGDVGAAEAAAPAAAWADVIISNFAIQYPIWAGRGEQVIHNLEAWLAPNPTLQIANSYSAQSAFIGLIDKFGQRLPELALWASLRETFVVPQYTRDAPDLPPRLVPRADVFLAPTAEGLPGRINVETVNRFIDRHDGSVVRLDSLGELSHLMAAHAGLDRGSSMVHYAEWHPDDRAGTGYLMPRELLLSFGHNPLQPGILFGS